MDGAIGLLQRREKLSIKLLEGVCGGVKAKSTPFTRGDPDRLVLNFDDVGVTHGMSEPRAAASLAVREQETGRRQSKDRRAGASSTADATSR
jgi:hypothetical protein